MAQNTRQKIERAAIQLIAAKGMDAVSMRDIAKTVGVSEAALYRHFDNKDALIWDIFTQHYTEFADRLEQMQSGEKTIKRKLFVMVTACCTFFDEDRDLFSFLLLTQHIQRLAPKNYEAKFPAMMRILLRSAIADKEIPKQNIDLATAMVMGCVLQTALYCLYTQSKMWPYVKTLSDACNRIIQGN